MPLQLLVRLGVLFTLILLLPGCGHLRPGGSTSGTVKPDNAYANGWAAVPFSLEHAGRATFRIRSKGSGYHAVSLTRPGEKFGPEVASITTHAREGSVTLASVVLPEGDWVLRFSGVEDDVAPWDYEVEQLPSSAVVEVQEGLSYQGELTAKDAQNEGGARSDLYRFRVKEPKRYRITVKSKDIRYPMLTVYLGKLGDKPGRKDWNEPDGRYPVQLAKGDVFVEVHGRQKDDLGAYTFEISDAKKGATPSRPPAAPSAAPSVPGCPQGTAEGCHQAAHKHQSGDGARKDLAQARRLFELGCNGGSLPACHDLGLMLEAGEGGPVAAANGGISSISARAGRGILKAR